MTLSDPWWPRAAPTRTERVLCAIWLIVCGPLMVAAYNGWVLAGRLDFQSVVASAVLTAVILLRRLLFGPPRRKQQALYIARSIQALLDETGGEWDWDDFRSDVLPEADIDQLRQIAGAVQRPLSAADREALLELAGQAKAIANSERE